MTISGTCKICGQRIALDELVAHMADEHDIAITVVHWPDGQTVAYEGDLAESDEHE